MVSLGGCTLFGSRTPPSPEPTELIVTGAPAASEIFVDGVRASPAAVIADRPQVLKIIPGSHTVEIHRGEPVVYREELFVNAGEHRVVTVLSGSTR